MKKLIAGLMAIGMMCAASAPVFAADQTIDQDSMTGSINFSYTKSAATYSITIPDSVSIVDASSASFAIKLTAAENIDGKKIQVTADNNPLTLQNSGGDKTVNIELSGGNIQEGNKKLLAEFTAADQTKSFTATIAPNAEADTYTGTMNLSVAIVDAG